MTQEHSFIRLHTAWPDGSDATPVPDDRGAGLPYSDEGATGLPRRGVTWVLAWAASFAMVAAALVIMLRFAALVQAEAALAEAARAGVVEAGLPKATHRTVCRVTTEQLVRKGWPDAELVVVLTKNDRPFSGLCRAQPEDRFAVTVVMPAREALPRWLRLLGSWPADNDELVLASSGRVLQRSSIF